MDKLTLISGTLFLAADIFAIVSLAMPDWIITETGGNFFYWKENILNAYYRRKHKTRPYVDLYDLA